MLDSSQSGTRQALQLNGYVERLGEHTLTMERAARQYLVLGARALRATFERAAAEAATQLDAMQAAQVPAPLVARRRRLATLRYPRIFASSIAWPA